MALHPHALIVLWSSYKIGFLAADGSRMTVVHSPTDPHPNPDLRIKDDPMHILKVERIGLPHSAVILVHLFSQWNCHHYTYLLNLESVWEGQEPKWILNQRFVEPEIEVSEIITERSVDVHSLPGTNLYVMSTQNHVKGWKHLVYDIFVGCCLHQQNLSRLVPPLPKNGITGQMVFPTASVVAGRFNQALGKGRFAIECWDPEARHRFSGQSLPVAIICDAKTNSYKFVKSKQKPSPHIYLKSIPHSQRAKIVVWDYSYYSGFITVSKGTRDCQTGTTLSTFRKDDVKEKHNNLSRIVTIGPKSALLWKQGRCQIASYNSSDNSILLQPQQHAPEDWTLESQSIVFLDNDTFFMSNSTVAVAFNKRNGAVEWILRRCTDPFMGRPSFTVACPDAIKRKFVEEILKDGCIFPAVLVALITQYHSIGGMF